MDDNILDELASRAREIARLRAEVERLQTTEGIQWRRVNAEPFEYAIQQGRRGDEFVVLLNGSCLRRAALADGKGGE